MGPPSYEKWSKNTWDGASLTILVTAKLQMKLGTLCVGETAYLGRLAVSRSMLDLSVDGFDAVDSVRGWLGADNIV